MRSFRLYCDEPVLATPWWTKAVPFEISDNIDILFFSLLFVLFDQQCFFLLRFKIYCWSDPFPGYTAQSFFFATFGSCQCVQRRAHTYFRTSQGLASTWPWRTRNHSFFQCLSAVNSSCKISMLSCFHTLYLHVCYLPSGRTVLGGKVWSRVYLTDWVSKILVRIIKVTFAMIASVIVWLCLKYLHSTLSTAPVRLLQVAWKVAKVGSFGAVRTRGPDGKIRTAGARD